MPSTDPRSKSRFGIQRGIWAIDQRDDRILICVAQFYEASDFGGGSLTDNPRINIWIVCHNPNGSAINSCHSCYNARRELWTQFENRVLVDECADHRIDVVWARFRNQISDLFCGRVRFAAGMIPEIAQVPFR